MEAPTATNRARETAGGSARCTCGDALEALLGALVGVQRRYSKGPANGAPFVYNYDELMPAAGECVPLLCTARDGLGLPLMC